MAGGDVRSPCGEFAKRQGIIHFAVPESRKLSYQKKPEKKEKNLNFLINQGDMIGRRIRYTNWLRFSDRRPKTTNPKAWLLIVL